MTTTFGPLPNAHSLVLVKQKLTLGNLFNT
jgi:hypothetical protein